MSTSPRRNSIAATDDLYEKKKTRKRSYSLGGSHAVEEFRERANPGKGILKRYSSFGLDPDTKDERTYNDDFEALNNTVIGIPNSIMFASKQMTAPQEKEPASRSKGRRSRVSFASHARVRWYQNESDRSRFSSDSPPSATIAPSVPAEEQGNAVPKESSETGSESNSSEATTEPILSNARHNSPPPDLQENETNSDMDVTNSPPSINPISTLPNPSPIATNYPYASQIASSDVSESPPIKSSKARNSEEQEAEMSMDVTMRFHDDNSYISGIESLKGTSSTEQTPFRQFEHTDDFPLSYHRASEPKSIPSLDRGIEEEQDMMLTRSIDIPPTAPEDFSNQMDISMELTSSHISPIRPAHKVSVTGTLGGAPSKDNKPSIGPPTAMNISDSPSQNPTDMDLTTTIPEKQLSPPPSSEEEAMDITQTIHSVASPVHTVHQSETQPDFQELRNNEFLDAEEDEMNVTNAFDGVSPSKNQLNDNEEPMDVTGVISLPFSQMNENNNLPEHQEETGMDLTLPIQRFPSPKDAPTTYEETPPHKKSKLLNGNVHVKTPSRSEIHSPKKKAALSSPSPISRLDRSATKSSRRKQRFSTSTMDMDTRRKQRLSTIRNARKSISTLNDLDFVSFSPTLEQNSVSNASPRKNDSTNNWHEIIKPASASPLRREVQPASSYASPAPESSSSGYFANSKFQEMEKDSFISPIAIKLQPFTLEGTQELGSSMDVNIMNEESALHATDLPDIVNEAVPTGEEKQKIEADQETSSSSFDPVLPALTLDEFLDMTEIEFLDNITSSKRRETIISGPLESPQLTTAQLLESYYLQFPILELYRFSCQKLEEYIIEGKDFVAKMAEDAYKNNPLLFYEYRKASSEMKALMNSQFRIIKTFSRLQAQGYWYEWREALMQGIKQELNENHLKLRKNLIQVSETSSKLFPFFEELRTSLSTVSTKVEALRKRKELFGHYNKELVFRTQSKFEDLQRELKLKKEILVERQTKKKNLEKEMDDLSNRCKDLELRCEEEREFYNANQDFEYDEITEYQQQMSELQRKLGWTILSIRPNQMKLIWNHSLQPFHVFVLLQVHQQGLDLNVKAEIAKRPWTVSGVFDIIAEIFHSNKSKLIKKNIKLLKPEMDKIAAYWNQLQELLLDFERLKLYWPYVSFNREKQCIVIRLEMYLHSRALKLLIEFSIPESALMKQNGAVYVYEATSVRVHSVYDDGLNQEPEILKVLLEKLHSVSINAYSFACFEVLSIYH
ncbi:NMS complex subunit, Spc105/KNL-1 family member, blinkin, Spc7 [Schizosaccharomyces osmophilus]|uniref:NMS complex subunit, Spc105/KNL-1 family member, blinkin, Spc7 n=1 Tax=Schizosaccharomyces osmophilus TaxID=2545709 RepID=A0AAF0AYH5_9SCHI|nr:NMS complex subunit, Spc105/KNL-1 family member, blinkin, Spc7 [Schizosaccharomyces osmophilus]WBW75587.1 NMS complex subunit, Spc105/KNL-1 family member, blinkin, Spc7 [Schizosaccharomyces osmophilus]